MQHYQSVTVNRDREDESETEAEWKRVEGRFSRCEFGSLGPCVTEHRRVGFHRFGGTSCSGGSTQKAFGGTRKRETSVEERKRSKVQSKFGGASREL